MANLISYSHNAIGQSFLCNYSYEASQKTHCLSWNMHVHYCIPKKLSLQPILINLVHILPPCLFKLHFNVPSFFLQLHLASTLRTSWKNSDHLILLKCTMIPDHNLISQNKKVKLKKPPKASMLTWGSSDHVRFVQIPVYQLCRS